MTGITRLFTAWPDKAFSQKSEVGFGKLYETIVANYQTRKNLNQNNPNITMTQENRIK